MKKITFLLASLLIAVLTVFAQPPQAFKYKAVIRDRHGRLIMNQPVSMRISILQGSETGLPVYVETHTPYTNLYGVIELEIGRGMPESGTIDAIDWGVADYFVKVEMDPKGKRHGNEDYTIIGTSQLLSVPYALYAGSVKDNDDTDNDPTNEIQVLSLEGDILILTTNEIPIQIDLAPYLDNTDNQNLSSVLTLGNDASANNISNLADPVDAQDAATKAYVDAAYGIQSMSVSAIGDTLRLSQSNWVIIPGISEANYQDTDIDNDGIPDANDNCPTASNPDQADSDNDGVGDVCDISIPGEPVTDIEGNIYNTVIIGTQTWMAKNLMTAHYIDNTEIPLITDNTEWSVLETPAYCWYDNDDDYYKNTYGALYNWYVVETGQLCPAGWHVPNDEEWTTLIDYLSGNDIAGLKLKAIDFGGNNESGFSALPGGLRYYDSGDFYSIDLSGVWWSSSEYSASDAWYRGMLYNSNSVNRNNDNKNLGISVRCLKD